MCNSSTTKRVHEQRPIFSQVSWQECRALLEKCLSETFNLCIRLFLGLCTKNVAFVLFLCLFCWDNISCLRQKHIPFNRKIEFWWYHMTGGGWLNQFLVCPSITRAQKRIMYFAKFWIEQLTFLGSKVMHLSLWLVEIVTVNTIAALLFTLFSL